MDEDAYEDYLHWNGEELKEQFIKIKSDEFVDFLLEESISTDYSVKDLVDNFCDENKDEYNEFTMQEFNESEILKADYSW